MLKQEAKSKIEELNSQVCSTSELTSASVIESQQEEITKYPSCYNLQFSMSIANIAAVCDIAI